eukprot:TRINITY_DN39299_c0_g1_i1.p2 TRINITY_DN39299_c0_g1~~TRINITY_DN39299_c0_g1_i1.p2  ORF type:complete len:384 (+),score=128.95 TRINITY_DN39299_c0_g1_i1:70-1152(+)
MARGGAASRAGDQRPPLGAGPPAAASGAEPAAAAAGEQRPPPGRGRTVAGRAARAAGADGQRPPWRRALWARQPYADDYVPPAFLEGLRTNAQLQTYHYSALVRESTPITQQITVVVLFCVAFARTHDGTLRAEDLLQFDCAAAVCFAAARIASEPAPSVRAAGRLLCDWALFAALLLLLSPLLATLTRPWADDTLTAVCTVLLVAHLLLCDYRWLNAKVERQTRSSVASLSAATFAAVLLASRLSSATSAFALLGLHVLIFGVAPPLQRPLRTRAPEAAAAFTWLLVGTCMGLLPSLSPVLACLYAVCVAALTLVVPWWFLREHQRLKQQISGPWDEARPANSQAAAEWATAGLLGAQN